MQGNLRFWITPNADQRSFVNVIQYRGWNGGMKAAKECIVLIPDEAIQRMRTRSREKWKNLLLLVFLPFRSVAEEMILTFNESVYFDYAIPEDLNWLDITFKKIIFKNFIRFEEYLQLKA